MYVCMYLHSFIALCLYIKPYLFPLFPSHPKSPDNEKFYSSKPLKKCVVKMLKKYSNNHHVLSRFGAQAQGVNGYWPGTINL